MNQPAQKKDAKAIFSAAIEYYQPEQWEAYIVDACGEDETLRQRVRALLDAHQQSDNYLDAQAEKTDDLAITERPGMRIGPYKLLQQIGEGGFGVVYMAEQVEPVRRKVALKIIKPGMDTKQVIARFEAERQALAMMDHPNVAKVLDAGATESGRPYFVMELVKGIPITEFCDTNKLPARERLKLFVTVCRAVQHAHHKGVIHRDLKPTNVMVTIHDNKPMPIIIDFGVSKAISHQLTEKTLFTAFGQMIGTPAYMSPEQAQMSHLDIDTRSDIYSLGVLLYELLTGGPPLDAERLRGTAYVELQRLIREEEAPKPSTRLSTLGDASTKIAQLRGTDPKHLGQFLRGDLDWIILKALDKERSRRYETANGLANDIERFLSDEAVEACPPSAMYRLRKYVRRNRSFVVAGSLVMASMFMGLVVSIAGFVQAAHERDSAVEAEKRAVEAANVAERERELAVDAEAEADEQRKEAQAVIALLGELIGSANPEDLKWPKYTVLEQMEDFSAKLEGRLTDQPAVEATVRLMLSDVYRQFYMWDQALVHADRAYELRRNIYGDEDELTIRALQAKGMHMSSSLSENTRHEGAEILRKIVELHPPFMDQDPGFTLRTKDALHQRLRGEEGLRLFRDLLEEAESKLDHDHPITSRIRYNYASCLRDAYRLDEAEEQLLAVVKAQEPLSGNENVMASFYRVQLARVLAEKEDDNYEHAKQMLIHELELQQRQLGYSHQITFVTLLRLLQTLRRDVDAQLADDLRSEFIAGMTSEDGPQSLSQLYCMASLATLTENRGTLEGDKLVELAVERYVERLSEIDPETEPLGPAVGIHTAFAATLNGRPDLAEQVARAAWDAYGEKNATVSLASALVNAMLTNGKTRDGIRFLQDGVSADSDLFRRWDYNSDLQITSTEVYGFWVSPRRDPEVNRFWDFPRRDQLDGNSDGLITPDETGESMWRFLIDVDRDKDGAISRREIDIAKSVTKFIKKDVDRDGQLGKDEWPGERFDRYDTNHDGNITMPEFVDRPPTAGPGGVRLGGPPFSPSPSLTPQEKFKLNDLNSDERVTADEADETVWKSIVEFDLNGDEAVDLSEYEQGLQQRAMERAARFFDMMDTNSDGQASEEEGRCRSWTDWIRFDANGDKMLSKEEFLESRKYHD